MPGWIPVSEREAPEGKYVAIVYQEAFARSRFMARRYGSLWWLNGKLISSARVTHWYDGDPLPSPPEEET